MADWRLKSPDKFPEYFHQALYDGRMALISLTDEARIKLLANAAKEACHREADQFRYFRWCLRQHPMHPLHQIEMDYTIKLLTRRSESHPGYVSTMWNLWLVVRHRPDTATLSALLRK